MRTGTSLPAPRASGGSPLSRAAGGRQVPPPGRSRTSRSRGGVRRGRRVPLGMTAVITHRLLSAPAAAERRTAAPPDRSGDPAIRRSGTSAPPPVAMAPVPGQRTQGNGSAAPGAQRPQSAGKHCPLSGTRSAPETQTGESEAGTAVRQKREPVCGSAGGWDSGDALTKRPPLGQLFGARTVRADLLCVSKTGTPVSIAPLAEQHTGSVRVVHSGETEDGALKSPANVEGHEFTH